jgi:hypothetical protein
MVNGQVDQIINDPTITSYFDKQQQIEQYLQQMPTPKSEDQEKEIKAYNRWNWFWKDRVNPSGSFDAYPDALSKYYSNSLPVAPGLPLWEPIGPSHQNGQFNSSGEAGRCGDIWVNPSAPNTIIAAASGGGLWKTVNGGDSWYELGNGSLINGVQALAVDPTNNQVIYVASGLFFNGYSRSTGRYCTGVWKSTDGGTSFTRIETGISGMLFNQPAVRILINPNNPQILLLAFSRAIYRSSNGGTTWTKVYSTTDTSVEICSIEQNPNDLNTVMVGGYNLLLKSTNGFQTYTSLANTIAINPNTKISVDFDRNNQVFIFYVNISMMQANVYKSIVNVINWGDPLIEISMASISPWAQLMKISPEGNIFVGSIGLKKFNSDGSIDGCAGLHPDKRGIAFASTTNEDLIYVTSDGGISKSKNTEGTDFTQINSNLSINEFYDVAIDNDHPGIYVAGAHDNGTYCKYGSN